MYHADADAGRRAGVCRRLRRHPLVDAVGSDMSKLIRTALVVTCLAGFVLMGLVALVAVLLLLTFVPPLVTFLPNLLF